MLSPTRFCPGKGMGSPHTTAETRTCILYVADTMYTTLPAAVCVSLDQLDTTKLFKVAESLELGFKPTHGVVHQQDVLVQKCEKKKKHGRPLSGHVAWLAMKGIAVNLHPCS